MTQTISLPYNVPYYAQVASPELAEDIFVRGLNPVLDPRWAESGAASPQEYAYWVERACGVACLKMCVEALGGPVYSLLDWANRGVERGAYLVRRDENGDVNEIGWIHAGLAALAREVGLTAEAKPAELNEIADYLREGYLVIASVSYEAGDDRLPITKKGGHLMVVVGAEVDEDVPLAFIVNNPSGRRSDLQAGARMAVERFGPAYSGRVILVH
jgi:hypothetical protein